MNWDVVYAVGLVFGLFTIFVLCINSFFKR